MFGSTGKIIKVNLSNKKIEIEKPQEKFYRMYMGGRNIAAYYLLNEVPENADPYSDKNILVVATSILTGTVVPGSSRVTIAGKSPLTGGYGEAETGGKFGPELKKAGYDGIVVSGVSSKPVYLYINNDSIEIKDASHLWGKETAEVQSLIYKELNNKKCSVIQCGIAGENLVRYSCVVNDLGHFAGRTGLGSIMGHKKIRAIVVNGSGKVPVKNPEKILEYAKWFSTVALKEPVVSSLGVGGTARGIDDVDASGMLPTRNFRQGSFEGSTGINLDTMHKTYKRSRKGCFACPVRCKQINEAENTDLKYNLNKDHGAPEYETVAMLGSNCAIGDAQVVSKANELCARYGIDTISAGGTVAFIMECFENDVISKKDFDFKPVKFGDGEGLLDLIEKIAKREGIGDLLAEGSYRAAQKIGSDTYKYSMTVKKQELPAHEPRGKWSVGLGYALSPTGADHLITSHDPSFAREGNPDKEVAPLDITDLNKFGIYNPVPTDTLSPDKIRINILTQNFYSLFNILDMCAFIGPTMRRVITIEHLADLISYTTGWKTGVFDLIKVGERGVNMTRAFNMRGCFSSEDDTLPDRMFDPIENGTLKGNSIDKNEFKEGLHLAYDIMGWDKKGIPKKGKLYELSLDWIDEMLVKYR